MANTFSMEDLPELRTPRLLLRPYRSDDVDDVLAYATDPEWGRYLPLPEPYTRRSAEEFVARCMVLVDWETQLRCGRLSTQGRVSGGISLTTRGSATQAEMGYSIARPALGPGPHDGGSPGRHRTTASSPWGWRASRPSADIRNKGSWRVMEKLGMEREGVMRSNRLVRDTRVDDVFYAILREGWSPPA